MQIKLRDLYCERTIRNGNTVIRLANAAPAPKATNNAGNAQHINVDDEANKDKSWPTYRSFFIS